MSAARCTVSSRPAQLVNDECCFSRATSPRSRSQDSGNSRPCLPLHHVWAGDGGVGKPLELACILCRSQPNQLRPICVHGFLRSARAPPWSLRTSQPRGWMAEEGLIRLRGRLTRLPVRRQGRRPSPAPRALALSLSPVDENRMQIHLFIAQPVKNGVHLHLIYHCPPTRTLSPCSLRRPDYPH